MAIKYEAYTRQGQKVKGVLQTDSEEDAYGMLEEDELVPYRLRLVTPRRSLVQLMPGLFKPKPQQIIDFTRQLSTLLDSGIPLRRALAVQRDQTASAGLKEAVDRIIQDIEAGERFSGAFSRHGTVFFLRMVRVGEATGGIPLILSQLTENLQRRKVVKDRVRRALVYPAISLAVAMVAAFVLVTYALPNLTSLLKEFGGELPLPTQILIGISGFLETYAVTLFLPLFGLMVGVGVLTRTAPGRRVQDRVLLRIPVAGKILQGSNMFFMTTTLSTLLKGGVPPIEAMTLSGEVLENTVFRSRLAQVTRRASEGTRLGEAFEEQGGFPNILAQAVTTGEIRGNVADALASLADYYEDVTDRAVSGATELIQPAVILVVAGVVGFVAVAVISGIYSSLGSVGA